MIGSTWGEWKATSVGTSRAITSRSCQAVTRSRTVGAAPAITVDCGEATTATTTSLMPHAVSSESTCCAVSSTDTVTPVPATRDISRERRQITRAPSPSDKAPATTAEAASPRECPITAPGRTPWAFIVAASATCMVNSVGWTRS